MNKRIAIACAAAAGIVSAASGQNLLMNGSFESALNYDGNDVGNWNAFFGGAPFQMAESITPLPELPPIDGTQVLQIGTTGQPDTFVGVTQRVAVNGDAEYTFSFYAREIVDMGYNAEFRIEWYDAGGAVIGDQFGLNQDITASLTDSFQLYSMTHMAPTNAAFATAVIAMQTFGGVPDPYEGFVQFDGAAFVPAPSAAAMLGLAGLAGVRRRR